MPPRVGRREAAPKAGAEPIGADRAV